MKIIAIVGVSMLMSVPALAAPDLAKQGQHVNKPQYDLPIPEREQGEHINKPGYDLPIPEREQGQRINNPAYDLPIPEREQ